MESYGQGMFQIIGKIRSASCWRGREGRAGPGVVLARGLSSPVISSPSPRRSEGPGSVVTGAETGHPCTPGWGGEQTLEGHEEEARLGILQGGELLWVFREVV